MDALQEYHERAGKLIAEFEHLTVTKMATTGEYRKTSLLIEILNLMDERLKRLEVLHALDKE
jgi:hypothetical protein